MLSFKNIKLYRSEVPAFADAAYFMDDLGRDWYEVRDALPAGAMLVLVGPTEFVHTWTPDAHNIPLSIAEGHSVYQVDHLPEDLKNWSMYYSPEKGFYELKGNPSD